MAVASALVLLGGLGACKGSEPDKGTDGGTPKIAFIVQNTSLSYAKEMGRGFEAGAKLSGGVEATVTGPQVSDGSKQVEIFRSLKGTTTGGISVAAQEPELFAPDLAEAGKGGLPLIAVDIPPAAGSGLKLYIGNDNRALGRDIAMEAIKRLPPNAAGKVIIGTNAPGLPALEHRADGIRAAFAEKLPKVRVMGPFDTHFEVPANKAAWQGLVKANPGALAFMGTGDIDAFNLAAIRDETKGTWLAGGFGLDERTLTGVKAGKLFAAMSPEHYVKGALAAWLAAERAKRGTAMPEGWLYTPGLAVTAANVDEIMKRQSSESAKIEWFGPQIRKMTADLKPYLRPMPG